MLIILLFSVSFVFAANGWGDINTGNGGDEVLVEDESLDDAEAAPIVYDNQGSSVADTEYTLNFYIAIGFAVVGVLVVAFFIYLFLRNPKNKWKKNSKVVK